MTHRAWGTNDFTKWVLWERRLKAELGRHPKVIGIRWRDVWEKGGGMSKETQGPQHSRIAEWSQLVLEWATSSSRYYNEMGITIIPITADCGSSRVPLT